jgi:hypothetical protein
MKWTLIIQQKLKVALLLGSIMLLIGFTAVMQRKNMQDLKQSYSSMYYDRLIPATDIFFLTQNLHDKRLLIEKLLYSESVASVEELKRQLIIDNDSINKLIAKFEGTYLVKDELKYLQEFKKRVKHYQGVEENILTSFSKESKTRAQQYYENEGKEDLLKTIQFLVELTHIQSSVGLDLIHDSQGIISISDLVLTIQIAIAIIIGTIVQALIFSSRIIDRKDQHFNLN